MSRVIPRVRVDSIKPQRISYDYDYIMAHKGGARPEPT